MADRPYRDFERVEQAQSEKARRLFEYWLRLKRNGRPGPRTAFDPTEVPSLLSSLLLGDIEADPFRVFFRLVGTQGRGVLAARLLRLLPRRAGLQGPRFDRVARLRIATFTRTRSASSASTG